MKIAFSAIHVRRNYNPSQEVYTANLLRAMGELLRGDMRVCVLVTDENRGLFSLGGYEVVECPFIASVGKRLAWEQKELPRMLKSLDVDIYHGAGNTAVFGFKGRQVITAHYTPDYPVSSLKARAQLAWRRLLMGRSIRTADAVICASKYLSDGLERMFYPGGAKGKFHVIPMGVEAELYSPHAAPGADEEILRRYKVRQPYFLAYAHILGLKNDTRIMRAWAAPRNEMKESFQCNLVMMGDPASEKAHGKQLLALGPLREDVIFTGFVSRDDLAALYRGALALIFPSLAESFGLCILEAMSCGTPVMTGTVTAMPEVAGGAAMLVDPSSEDEIRDGMKLLFEDEKERERLRAAGLERARNMNWRRTAEETLKLYASLG